MVGSGGGAGVGVRVAEGGGGGQWREGLGGEVIYNRKGHFCVCRFLIWE